jgi:hypothetical protein
MSDSAHLLIPFASSPEPGCQEALRGLTLPRLEQLLARLAPGESDTGTETSLSLPHARWRAPAASSRRTAAFRGRRGR